jgi:hypothetical protein
MVVLSDEKCSNTKMCRDTRPHLMYYNYFLHTIYRQSNISWVSNFFMHFIFYTLFIFISYRQMFFCSTFFFPFSLYSLCFVVMQKSFKLRWSASLFIQLLIKNPFYVAGKTYTMQWSDSLSLNKFPHYAYTPQHNGNICIYREFCIVLLWIFFHSFSHARSTISVQFAELL